MNFIKLSILHGALVGLVLIYQLILTCRPFSVSVALFEQSDYRYSFDYLTSGRKVCSSFTSTMSYAHEGVRDLIQAEVHPTMKKFVPCLLPGMSCGDYFTQSLECLYLKPHGGGLTDGHCLSSALPPCDQDSETLVNYMQCTTPVKALVTSL